MKALSDPLVFVLHLSYAWLPTGFVLLGCTMLHPLLPVSSAVHALGAGAMGAMTLAVMMRATLGHTGRPLVAYRATVLIYILVLSLSLLLVIAPLLPFVFILVISVSCCLFSPSFLLFFLLYFPFSFLPSPFASSS